MAELETLVEEKDAIISQKEREIADVQLRLQAAPNHIVAVPPAGPCDCQLVSPDIIRSIVVCAFVVESVNEKDMNAMEVKRVLEVNRIVARFKEGPSVCVSAAQLVAARTVLELYMRQTGKALDLSCLTSN
jgi:hypothetical protein